MASNKLPSGAKPRDLSIGEWNRHCDASEAYHRTMARGTGQTPPVTGGRDSSIIKVKNDSGSDRRTGEILEFSGLQITNLEGDVPVLWLTGAEPTLANGFGVLVRPIPDGDMDDCQVAGACIALVNVTSTSHKFAAPASSTCVLESGTTGPLRIIYSPGGTGVLTCAVAFQPSLSSAPETGIPFINNSGFTIPEYAIMAPVGTLLVGTNYVVADLASKIFHPFWLVNGASAVPNLGTSRGKWLFDSTGPVLLGNQSLVGGYGHEFGPYPGFWGAYPYQRGFFSYGDAYSIGSVSVVDCRQRQVVELFGKTAATLSQGGSVNFEIWQRGSDGKKRRSPWSNITVYDLFLGKGETVKRGVFGKASWHSDYWEGDFACDPDTTDTSQYSPGGKEDFTFSGPGTSDSTPNSIAIGII